MNSEPTIDVNSTVEMQKNVTGINNSMKMFMNECLKLGNVDKCDHFMLRFGIMQDSLHFTRIILPFINKSLSNLHLFFYFLGSMNFERFVERRDIILKGGKIVEREFKDLLELVGSAQAAFVERKIQATKIQEKLELERERINNKIRYEQKKFNESHEFSFWYLIPGINVIAGLINTKEGSEHYNQSILYKQKLQIVEKSIVNIKEIFLFSINALKEAIGSLVRFLSTVNANMEILIEKCSLFSNQYSENDKIKKYPIFHRTIVEMCPNIVNSIPSTINEFNVIKNEIDSLPIVKLIDQLISSAWTNMKIDDDSFKIHQTLVNTEEYFQKKGIVLNEKDKIFFRVNTILLLKQNKIE